MANLRTGMLLLFATGPMGCSHPPQTKAAEEYQAILATNPSDSVAHYNLGIAYQLQERPELALPQFEAVLQTNPGDWPAVAKLVQVNQALGKLDDRDRWRGQLLSMYKAGKVVNPTMDAYCRDQFRSGKYWVIVLESFELKGSRAVRYSFNVLSAAQGADPVLIVSLGSYDLDTNYARHTGEIGPNERIFHLDGYWSNRSHASYAFYRNEPDYDSVRKQVVGILERPGGVSSPTDH